MFTVDARHLNISMVFLTQRLFVNDEYFRQISQNSDYFCLFKNPRNSSEIRNLAQQMTPGNMILVDIYRDATVKPFSYLFINLTQECDYRVKYLSDLFDGDVKVYVEEGKGYKKMVGEGSFKNFILKENVTTNLKLTQFRPIQQVINPNLQTQHQNVYFQPVQNTPETCTTCQQENLNEREDNARIKKESASTSTNTFLPSGQYTQTIRPQYNTAATGTDIPQHRQIQTTMPQHASMSTETNRYQDGGIQTDQIRYVNTGANTHSMGNAIGMQTDPVRGSNRGSNTESQGNAIAIQTNSGNVWNTGTNTIDNAMETDEPQYRSEYARQIAAMDTTENNQHVSLPPIAHQQPLFLPPPPNQNQIIQRNHHPIALPPIAHQQSTFVQPPALMGPQQQLALPQPHQQPALRQHALVDNQNLHTQVALPPITYQQQLALPQPQQHLAIDYDPRGVKRINVDSRIGDRKKVLLEDERTDAVKRKRENIRRNIERKIRKLDDEATDYMQTGEGYSKLSEKIEDAGYYSNKWVNLFLNDEEIEDICASVQVFLDGQMKFDDEIQHDIDVTLQDSDLRRNMDEIIDEKYQIEEKREFLLNSSGGVKMVNFVNKYLLGDMIDYFNTLYEIKQRCCKQLKKKLKKIMGKDEGGEKNTLFKGKSICSCIRAF